MAISRPHVPPTRPPYYTNNFNGTRNGRLAYPNVNQENIIHTNNLPPWFWTNNNVCFYLSDSF